MAGRCAKPWLTMRLYVGLAALAALAAPGFLDAQTSPPQPDAATFEVASIKRNTSVGPARALIQPGGRFTAVNAPVSQILRQAYEMLPFQVVNAPDWVTSERYDILAQAPEGVQGMPAFAPLLRSLLRDRFALQTHIETREMPIYHLVLARQDGKLGRALQPSSVDCTAWQAASGRGPASSARGAAAPPPQSQSDEPPCAQMGTPGRTVMRGFPLSQFARILGAPVNRIVVDRTGLTGTWNLVVEFTPDQMPNIPAGALPPGTTLPSPDGPSLFTAIEEQLGLKLESARGPVDVLVIERIERPTED